MLKSRVVTALILLLGFLVALFMLPTAGWAAVIILMVLQGSTEWSRLAKFKAGLAYFFWGASLFLMLGIVWYDAHNDYQQLLLLHTMVYVVSAIFWVIIVPTWMIVGWKVEHPVLLALTGWAVLIPTGLAMLDLRSISPWLLLLLMGLVWVADISAYFAGRKFGKNKLAPSISPGKTWEGVVGAMLGVSIYVALTWRFSPVLHQSEVLSGFLMASWWWVGLAVIGDLFESAIKRQAGVKDSGTLLPGHGGLLDRIDALTPTLPLAALVILIQQVN